MACSSVFKAGAVNPNVGICKAGAAIALSVRGRGEAADYVVMVLMVGRTRVSIPAVLALLKCHDRAVEPSPGDVSVLGVLHHRAKVRGGMQGITCHEAQLDL